VNSFHATQRTLQIFATAADQTQRKKRDRRHVADRLTQVVFHFTLDFRVAENSLQNAQAQQALRALGSHLAYQLEQ